MVSKKKLIMTEDQQQKRPSLGQEMLSVFGIFVAVFLLFCLVSFSFAEIGPGSAYIAPDNWGGKVGFFIAQIMLGFLGISAFWFIFLLLFFSFQYYSPKMSMNRLPVICLGCAGILFSSSALFSAMAGMGTINLFNHAYPAGGYFGNLLFGFFKTTFGLPGSILIFISLFIISLMVAARFSPYICGQKILAIIDRLKGFYQQKKEIFLNKRGAPTALENKKGAVSDFATRNNLDDMPRVREPVRPKPVDQAEKNVFQPVPVKAGEYQLPGLDLLDVPEHPELSVEREFYYSVSKKLEETLGHFGVAGKVVGISPGPIITTYEFSPAPGVKINKVVSLADDLALGLKAESVRIVGSVPGKAALGIEIPNPQRQIVFLRDIFADEGFRKSSSKLTLGLGMDVIGHPVFADLARMPHLLIAGATGAGKSVGINTIICSILFKATPEEVRFLLVDPKRIELSVYENIPHLLHPVVVDPKMASRALQWAVREMERRYVLMEEARVKSIAGYNKVAEEKLPIIVIVIDELADLMMVSSREVEDAVARLAQMARAAGMHLILATQRPSVDVLTGLIKANFPTRLSFKVSSKIDSRTILDSMGAEQLLGAGDMLFMPPGTSKLQRIHGAYISEKETERIVDFLKEQGVAVYDETVIKVVEKAETDDEFEDDYDEKYDAAVAFVCEAGQASISMVQRRLRVGYNRAARMIEMMEKEGIVGPADGSKPREVLARKTY